MLGTETAPTPFTRRVEIQALQAPRQGLMLGNIRVLLADPRTLLALRLLFGYCLLPRQKRGVDAP